MLVSWLPRHHGCQRNSTNFPFYRLAELAIIVSHCDYGVEKKRHKNAKYPRPLDFEAPALPLCYNCCQRHLRQGGCIAQKQYSCFSPNRPGFDSWLSEKFILMLPRFIDGVGLRKVNGGLKMLVKPVSYNLLELQKDTRGSKSNSKMRFLCKFVAGNWKVAPDLLNFLLFSSWKLFFCAFLSEEPFFKTVYDLSSCNVSLRHETILQRWKNASVRWISGELQEGIERKDFYWTRVRTLMEAFFVYFALKSWHLAMLKNLKNSITLGP